MLVRPEWREQDQFPDFRPDTDSLKQKFRFSPRSCDIIQIPDRYQLTVAEVMAAAINVPVIVLARPGPLDPVPHILERTLEKRIAFTKFPHGQAE